MQIQTCPEFGGCEPVLGLTHREVAELSGIGSNEKDTNAPFTRTLKQTPDLHSFGRVQHHWVFWLSNLLYFLKQAAEHFQMASFKREDGQELLSQYIQACAQFRLMCDAGKGFSCPCGSTLGFTEMPAACLLQHVSLHSLPACTVVTSWKEALEKVSKEFIASPMKQFPLWSCICSVTPNLLLSWSWPLLLCALRLAELSDWAEDELSSPNCLILMHIVSKTSTAFTGQQASDVCLCSSFYLACHHALRSQQGQCAPAPSPKAHNCEHFFTQRTLCFWPYFPWRQNLQVKRMADWCSGSFVEAWSFSSSFFSEGSILSRDKGS